MSNSIRYSIQYDITAAEFYISSNHQAFRIQVHTNTGIIYCKYTNGSVLIEVY